jgi:ketosteroid isomerase-like protein
MTPLEAAWMPPANAVTTFAEDWIAAWNDHDVDRILAHYCDDVVFTSPFVTMHAFAADGVVHGRDALRRYFVRALSNYPDLRFEPIAVVPGVDSVALHYRSVGGREAIEVMELDEERRVRRVNVHYTDPADSTAA